MTTITDRNGQPLSGALVYATPQGRRGIVIFTGREDGSEPFRPVRDAEGRVHLAYLGPDGEEPDLRTTEYAWLRPGDLTPTGVLPGATNPGNCARCNAFDDDRDTENVCAACRADEHPGTGEDEDDARYYVTSLDGTVTFAGPFEDWHAADTEAQRVEDETPGVLTDIRFQRR